MIDAMEIGKRLRYLRGNKSAEEVCMQTGIGRSALSNYENGIRIPRDEVKITLAKYYGKTVEAIFFNRIFTFRE